MPRHIAIYVRVSSASQQHASQLADLENYAIRQTEEVRWYQDTASGKSMERPGFQKILSEIAANNVSTLVCWRLDRLGRTAAGLTSLFQDLISRKVNLFSIKDSLDLSTPAGRLLAHVLASVAMFETEVRQERQLAGIAAARATGKRWGGSQKGRLLKVNLEQKSLIQDMKREGKGVSTIARVTGLSRPTIYRVLENHS